MTINTESTKRIYAGNGATVAFDYDFKIFVESDLLVTLVDDATGLVTLQALNVDYTVTGEGFEAGGKVTFYTPPALDTTIVILSNVPYTQPTDYKNQGRFFPETVENNFDRATRQILQLEERADRSLTLPAQVSGVSVELPVPVPLYVLGWAADGLSLQNFPNTGGGGGGGEVNTASNLGTGEGQVYASKSGADLRFRSIKQGTNVTITQSGTEITINAAGGGGGGGSVTSVGLSSSSPTAISVSGATPITSSGAWTLSLGANLLAWNAVTPASKADASAVTAALALKMDITSLSASTGTSLIGFIQSGTGAVSRVLQGKVRERLSVKDFGAVGNGSTDDRAAIILADAEAVASGRELFFPTGTYIVSSHILGLKGSWVGEPGSVVKAANALVLNGEGMLTWSSAGTFCVRNLTFEFQTRTITVGSEGVITFINCDDFLIEDCAIKNLTGTGISINGGRNCTISRCFITKATAAGTFNQSILVDATSRQSIGIRIRDCHMTGSAIFMCCINGWVEGCHISGWGFGGGISTQQSANSFRYYFTNNTIETSATAYDVNATLPNGIENWSAYAIMRGNQISECAGTGIACGGQYCTITDNVIFNNGTGWTVPIPAPGSGIVMQYADATYNGSYAIVRGNVCFDTRAGGSKRQKYGYEEQTSGIVGVFSDGNRYFGNATADEYILGTNSWFSRQVNSSGDWKVSTTGGGWKREYTCPILFTGAATFTAGATFGTLTATTTITAGTELIVESGNRVKLQGAANLTGLRYSSPNVDIYVGPSYAAGFGTNTTGFNGTTPVAKPTVTGSRGSNAALASLLTALASMGLITDSSS